MNFKNIAIASLIMLLGVSMTAAGADLAHPHDDGCTDKGSNACGGGGGGSPHHSGGGGHHSSGGSHHSGSGSVPLTGQSGSGSASLVPPLTPAIAPEVQQPSNTGFTFKEVLVPQRSHFFTMSPTNKYLDSSGAMHIVGEITNNGSATATVSSLVATIYGANNQILGLDYSPATPSTISPKQSAAFDFIVGGSGSADGVTDPSVITMVKYTLMG